MSKSRPGLTIGELFASWGSILRGRAPMLSIEVTRECPLSCPGCYAYGDSHLNNGQTLRQLSDLRGDALVHGVLGLVRKHRPLHVSLVGGEPLVRHRELSRILPELSREGVLKIANHGSGREMSPESPKRAVTPEEEENLREFLSSTFPALADAPIVYSRVCMYCDTNDGHFWIAPDPERPGLIVAAGDSGHGFKFAPVIGEIIADAAEGKSNPLLQKFRWRPEIRAGEQKEAARFSAG